MPKKRTRTKGIIGSTAKKKKKKTNKQTNKQTNKNKWKKNILTK